MNKLAKIIEIGIPINNDETGETSILLRPNEVKLLEKEFKKYSKLQQELQRKDNIINELKELLKNPYNQDCINQNNDFLDKINELENSGSDE